VGVAFAEPIAPSRALATPAAPPANAVTLPRWSGERRPRRGWRRQPLWCRYWCRFNRHFGRSPSISVEQLSTRKCLGDKEKRRIDGQLLLRLERFR